MKVSAARPRPHCAPDWYGFIEDCLRKAGKRLPDECRSGELLARFTASARAIHHGFMRSFGPLGWTDHKFMVMVVLSALDPAPLTPSQLALHAAVTRTSMTGVLDDLRGKGWIIANRNSEGDRRSVRVTLTAKGREAVAEAASLYLTMAGQIVRPLPPDDLVAFERICGRLRLAGEALAPQGTQSSSSAHPL